MEQQPRLPIWFLVVNCGVIAAAFVCGTWLGGRGQTQLPNPQGVALGLIHREILASHVEPQNAKELLDRAIAAMVSGLDDYSRYIPPTRVEAYEESTTGRYEGVGMVMRQHGEDLVVHFPFADGPADRAGIMPGDKIIAVDGKSVYELDADTRNRAATDLVRGPADSTVRLQLRRGDEELDVVVERDDVQRPAVKWIHMIDADHGLGYLHVTDFHRGIADGVEAAIRELQRKDALHGLLIDLRWNGGGSLDECVALCRKFQPDGTIVSTRRRGAEIERVEAVAADCKFPKLPIVILVNSDSASASEVFAGCLQDHDRAAIVGVRTYGKGVVNTVYSWTDFKLKLTTAHFYTPNGRNLGGSHRPEPGTPAGPASPGIAPDVEVPIDEAQLGTILRTLRAYEVPAAHRAAFARAAEQYAIDVAAPPRAADDPQVEKALEVLATRIADSNGK